MKRIVFLILFFIQQNHVLQSNVIIENGTSVNVGFRFWKKTRSLKKQFVSSLGIIKSEFEATCSLKDNENKPEAVDIYIGNELITVGLNSSVKNEVFCVREIMGSSVVLRPNERSKSYYISIDELEKRKASKKVVAK